MLRRHQGKRLAQCHPGMASPTHSPRHKRPLPSAPAPTSHTRLVAKREDSVQVRWNRYTYLSGKPLQEPEISYIDLRSPSVDRTIGGRGKLGIRRIELHLPQTTQIDRWRGPVIAGLAVASSAPVREGPGGRNSARSVGSGSPLLPSQPVLKETMSQGSAM